MLSVLVLLTFCQTTFAANFYSFTEYPQEITIAFATAGDASRAALDICPLPGDKKIAFSIRGDDTNKGHVWLARVLQKYGFKASFFLNEVDDKFAENEGKGFLEAGSSAGNHSLSHPRLPDLLPNKIYTELVIHQARIESRLDTTSVSFTLPFTVIDNPVDPAARQYIAEALRRAGIIVSADSFGCGLPDNEFFVANRLKWFNGADSNPQPEMLEKSFREAREIALTDPLKRCVFYGTHTQYSKEGLPNLEKWLQKHKDNPEIWKCNANEFGAYHYSYLHADPQKKVSGNNAVFTLTRFNTSDIGALLPLSVRITPTPVSVSVGGHSITPSADGIYQLPGIGNNVEKVGWIHEGGEDAKYPGVQMKLKFAEKENKLVLSLTNKSEKELAGVNVLFKAPMYWTTGVYNQQLARLPAGQSRELTVELGEISKDLLCNVGDWQFLVKADFNQGDSQGRLYIDTLIKREIQAQDCPRDRAMIVGPVADSLLTPEFLSSLSLAENPVKNFGSKRSEMWTILNYQNEGYREFLVNAAIRSSQDKGYWEWTKETQPYFSRKEKGSRLIILDFNAATDEDAVLLCPSHPNNLSAFYLNGTVQSFVWKNKWSPSPECAINVKAGHNRLVFINPITSDWLAKQFGMSLKIYSKIDRKEYRYLPIKTGGKTSRTGS